MQDAAVALDKATRDLRLAVRGENMRLAAARAFDDDAFEPALETLAKAVKELTTQLESQAERGEGLANCFVRAQELALGLKRWRGDESGADMIRWVEVYSQALSLNLTPLDIAPIFKRQMEGPWPLAMTFLITAESWDWTKPTPHVGAARLIIKTTHCFMCRQKCLIPTARNTKKR